MNQRNVAFTLTAAGLRRFITLSTGLIYMSPEKCLSTGGTMRVMKITFPVKQQVFFPC